VSRGPLFIEQDHLRPRRELVQVVGPPLHHHAALVEEPRAVVGPPERIFYRVRELVLDQVDALVQPLVEQRARNRPVLAVLTRSS